MYYNINKKTEAQNIETGCIWTVLEPRFLDY